MEKYIYLFLIALCVFLEQTSIICLPLFLFLVGIICAIAAIRVFIFRKYNLFLLFYKGSSENGSVEIIVQFASMLVYLFALSFIAIGSWLYLH
ncbi:porin [Enterococcus malodoratus]|uniref:porin n=1 Tax=Enterococcus malodoratus TaxID=71451 RepID=UPI00207340EF|nr:porin [Enterococcus malodoratus]